eukprot:TRINITY_DN20125_c0_g1_i1.p1 TRINITY_DN20125_c0_g1~~TRINITY_DN20125_c0_g1_i1.p1  ORF type:complete len:979 (+),score=230.02 TRINITY_DN20125_c0_g1_i1:64-2937(+)
MDPKDEPMPEQPETEKEEEKKEDNEVVKDEPTEATPKAEQPVKAGVKREIKEEGGGERKKVRFGGETPDVKQEVKEEKVEVAVEESEGARWGPGKGEGLYEKPPDVEACFKRVGRCDWDSEAWDYILRDLKRRKLEEVEDVYKRVLSIYPSCSTAISDYVFMINEDYALNAEEKRTKIDQIFMEKLRTYQHVTVWKSYTDYVLRHQQTDETQKAYNHCLRIVGHDFESSQLWTDYIRFLGKRGKEFAVQNEIRRAYHDMLKIPMKGLEDSWKAYQAWEHTIGSFKIPEALRSAHERAVYHYNTVLDRYSNLIDTQHYAKPLEVDYPEDIKIPTSPLLGKSVKKDFEQAALWYNIINHEMENPMGLEPSILKHRVVTMCKKALICMSKVPLFWYVHSRFLLEGDNYDEANKVLSEGLAACPTSLLLRLAYVDMLAFLQPNKLLDTPMKRPTEGNDGKVVRTIWQHTGQGMICEKGVEPKRILKFTPYVLGCAVFEDMLSRVPHGDLRTLTWVHFMRFLKSAARLEAQQEAYQKEYLQRAHKDQSTLSGPFYSAVARLEKVAPPTTAEGSLDPRSVLEKGYIRQKDEGSINPLFLLSYIDTLWGAGDDNTLRNLFSQLFESGNNWQSNANKNDVLLVYNKRVEFELWKGGLKGVHAAEKMREETFGKVRVGTYTRQLVHRYTYEGLVPASLREMQAIDDLEHAYFKLLTIGTDAETHDDLVTRSMKLHGESPLEENLAQHANPLRSRRAVGEPEVKTKWIHYQIPVSKKWSAIQQEPASRSVVTGTWNPKHAPKPEKDASSKSYLSGSGATRLLEEEVTQDDYAMMPSTVAHLAKKLPDRRTFQGVKPKIDYILDCFRKSIIPQLVEGKVPDENFAEAKQYLIATLGIDSAAASNISSLQKEAREKIEELRSAIASPEDRQTVDKCTLSLAQVLTHARARREGQRLAQQARGQLPAGRM